MKTSNLFYFIILSLSSFALQSFETGQYFTRINEDELASQTAFRSYIKDGANGSEPIVVQLIGMDHQALPEFYQSINKMIENKVVLYELSGGTLEESKAKENIWRELPANYYDRYQKIENRTGFCDSLGCISQGEALTYASCKELVHADTKLPPPGQKPCPLEHVVNYERPHCVDLDWIQEYGTPEQRMKFLDGRTLWLMSQHGITCTREEIDLRINTLYDAMKKDFAEYPDKKGQSRNLRHGDEKLRKDIEAVRAGTHNFNEFEKFVMVDRNEYIYGALEELFKRTPIPSDITVVYGAFHMPFVEDFLLAKGFAPLKGSDGWLTAARLTPMEYDEHKAPPTEASVLKEQAPEAQPLKESSPAIETPMAPPAPDTLPEEVWEVFVSKDGFTKVHLIGPMCGREWILPREFINAIPTDMDFLHRVLGGHFRSVLEDMRNADKALVPLKSVEVLFTPRNLPWVKERLIENGFVLEQIKNNRICEGPMIVVVENFVFGH